MRCPDMTVLLGSRLELTKARQQGAWPDRATRAGPPSPGLANTLHVLFCALGPVPGAYTPAVSDCQKLVTVGPQPFTRCLEL